MCYERHGKHNETINTNKRQKDGRSSAGDQLDHENDQPPIVSRPATDARSVVRRMPSNEKTTTAFAGVRSA